MSLVFPIEDDPRYRSYTAAAGQKVFPVKFPFQQNEDLIVRQTLALDGSSQILTLDADYSLSGAGAPADGSLTLSVGAAEGDLIEYWGEAIVERVTSVVQSGRFSAKSQDDEFDRSRIIQQELRRDVDRAFKAQLGQSGRSVSVLPAGHFYKADEDGNLIDGGPADEIPNAAGYAAIASEAAERAEAAKTALETVITPVGAWATGVDGSGVSDTVAAFQAIEALAEETIRLFPGNYRINSAWQPTKKLVIKRGAKLLIDDDADFDLSLVQPEIEDDLAQCFEWIGTGVGVVRGLSKVQLGWFAGDKHQVPVSCKSELDHMAASCASGARIEGGKLTLWVTGDSAVELANSQKIDGLNRYLCTFNFLSTATNLFDLTSAGASVENVGIYKGHSTTAASGTGINVAGGGCAVKNVRMSGLYAGVVFGPGSGGSVGFDLEVLDCISLGIYLHDTIEIWISNFIIVAPFSVIDLTTSGGALTVGNVLVGSTSGAQLAIGEIVSATRVRGKPSFQNCQVGETLVEHDTEGTPTGVTATVTALSRTSALGGMRLEGALEGCTIENGDIIGGATSLACDAVTAAQGSQPRYNYFQGVLFDSSENGCYIVDSFGLVFIGCWSSCRPGPGMQVFNSKKIVLSVCLLMNCGAEGLRVGAGADVKTSACVSVGNNGMDASHPAVNVLATGELNDNGSDFGGEAGFVNINGGASNTDYSIRVESGGVACLHGTDLRGSSTGPVSSASTLFRAYKCKGYANDNHGKAEVITNGSGIGTIAHGLDVQPDIAILQVFGDASAQLATTAVDGTDITFIARNISDGSAISGTLTVQFIAKTLDCAA